MEPIINWRELSRLGMPPPPPRPEGEKHENMWDRSADFYDSMAKMELFGTLEQLDRIPISPEDTVIDAGCGPGRITCQLAKRCKKVIAVDSSVKMMEKCRENIAANGFKNVETILLDWNEAVPGVNVPVADIALSSRSVGMQDLAKLSSFASRYAAIICWANGPSIPSCAGMLTKGAVPEGKRPPFPMRQDRRLSYNVQYNVVYDMGYEPNMNVVRDGFGRHFDSRQQAYEELSFLLKGDPQANLEVFAKNVDAFLTEKDGGFDFWIETRSFVLGWEVNPRKFDFN